MASFLGRSLSVREVKEANEREAELLHSSDPLMWTQRTLLKDWVAGNEGGLGVRGQVEARRMQRRVDRQQRFAEAWGVASGGLWWGGRVGSKCDIVDVGEEGLQVDDESARAPGSQDEEEQYGHQGIDEHGHACPGSSTEGSSWTVHGGSFGDEGEHRRFKKLPDVPASAVTDLASNQPPAPTEPPVPAGRPSRRRDGMVLLPLPSSKKRSKGKGKVEVEGPSPEARRLNFATPKPASSGSGAQGAGHETKEPIIARPPSRGGSSSKPSPMLHRLAESDARGSNLSPPLLPQSATGPPGVAAMGQDASATTALASSSKDVSPPDAAGSTGGALRNPVEGAIVAAEAQSARGASSDASTASAGGKAPEGEAAGMRHAQAVDNWEDPQVPKLPLHGQEAFRAFPGGPIASTDMHVASNAPQVSPELQTGD